ncbi:hypothetical protein ACV3RS_15685 [Clostridium perfringens]|uniref:hypothetical protein n=1 Tax=Clostridium perfringens TaxID=1502 RepID=UPI0029001861|nr:hypothetical protein [Clostridium perfringens]MDK0980855.1 hypothetical protein [Clostridium perfringens]MDU3019899.1 hypothetical protein [Clostridium perfringens]
MYFWTIQHKDVIDMLLKNKVYYPDFKYSMNSAAGLDMRAIYPRLLNCFNTVNSSVLNGVLFGFELSNLSEVTDLYHYLTSNPNISTCFNFWSKEYCILKLKINDTVNLLPIDFYDFIKLTIWITQNTSSISLLELNQCEIERISSNLSQGIVAPRFKSFTQIHYSHININDIVGVYPIINYKTNTIMELSDSAIKLKNILNLS